MLLSVLLIPFVQCLGYRFYDPGFFPLLSLPFFFVSSAHVTMESLSFSRIPRQYSNNSHKMG